MADKSEKPDIARTKRLKEKAMIKRTTVISSIQAVHDIALRVANEPAVVSELLVAVNDLDALWAQFEAEDNAVLDLLIMLNSPTEYSSKLPSEVRSLINATKAVANAHRPAKTQDEVPDSRHLSNSSRLPDIPLPRFNGDFHFWPTFRDRFKSLVDDRAGLSNIDKLYYLIGCLEGPASDSIRGIPVSAENYELAWSTLTTRFHRPRMVATSLINKLLTAPVSNQESLQDLNVFVSTFDETICLLNSLNIPNLGSFVLFSMAFRCLPNFDRKLFESTYSSDFPTVEELLDFVRTRISILENSGESRKVTKESTSFQQIAKINSKRSSPTSMVITKPTNSSREVCPYCTGKHALDVCNQFQALSVDDRNNWTREKRLCFSCLSEKHWSNKCRLRTSCDKCSRKHHRLLHGATIVQPSRGARPIDESVCAAASVPHTDNPSPALLGTALVHVRDRAGTWQTVRALVDCASQISAITVGCSDRLGLRPTKWTAPVSGLAGTPVLNVKGRVECNVQPRFATEPVLSVNAWVFPAITSDMPRKSLPKDIKGRYSNFALADPAFDVSSPVELLLGADVYPSIVDGRKATIANDIPTAFHSIFGWILIGPVGPSAASHLHSLPVSLNVSIENLISKFWCLEEPVAAPQSFTEDGRCEEVFRAEYTRLPSGRFAVPLPTRKPMSDLMFPRSRELAVKRFESLERRLSADPKLHKLYSEFMDEYLASGHMSRAESPGRYIIPHHAVYRSEDGNNKIRVVFDASAQTSVGSSLNKCLFQGPKLQQEIVDVLTRFRTYKFAFTSDICKMYRQILVLPEYRPFQHIVWRASPHHELVEYELNTVTYGMNCSPFLALRTLQVIADEDCNGVGTVRDALLRQTYVDDICVGADTEEEAMALQVQLVSKLSKSGMELKKWSSNLPAILDAVPSASRSMLPTPFETTDGSYTKVLGLQWIPTEDFFCCAFRDSTVPIYTKRGVLSLIARIFDPLGLFSPAIFRAKHIMQRTWASKLSWDDPLPSEIQAEWSSFVSDLPSLASFRIPRYINTRTNSKCYLLGFCDASQYGFAAAVYLRILSSCRDSSVFLLGTKTKLAPLTPLTVPRLELNAALLLARWMNRLKAVLEPRLNIIGVYAWTDSSIVLSWLTNPHESFKIYVSNRVHQVVSLLPECIWSHVRSENNPADCASRGILPSELIGLDLYWHGPEFIRDDPLQWNVGTKLIPLDELPETRTVSMVIHSDDTPVEWFHKFSSYDHLIRVVAHVYRFINRCRRQHEKYPNYITRLELDNAVQAVVIESQRCYFSSLSRELSQGHRISSKPLARLCPFFDENYVIRVGGRLRQSSLNYESKHPILLAKGSHLALLIARRWHKITCHAGPRILTAIISRIFWIVSIRSVLYDVCRKCTVCVRFDAKPPQPLMADLPSARVQQCRPFAKVGVDFAGPLQMREVRLRKSRTYKVYIAVFICLAVKAVHLEVVTELSTEAFLCALDRFIARRGMPSDIFSDCGTNFIGADKQLQSIVNKPENQTILANARSTCSWHFNPPSAPHFGGLWEAAVRSAKRLLIRVMGTHIFTYEEFTTVLTRVEAVLNSRPLTPLSSDPTDLDYLSPGHFLIGQPLLAIPPRVSPDAKLNLTNRWKLLDQCHQAFWRKWVVEYLTTLQERTKWTATIPNLKVNDIVIVINNQAPPLAWCMGRVIQLLPGSDGVVRVVKVLTRNGHLVRPVAKLVPLPTE